MEQGSWEVKQRGWDLVQVSNYMEKSHAVAQLTDTELMRAYR
jgi:hypothetical protein